MLVSLIDVIYGDVIDDDVISISVIYNMMKSHSEFLPTLLTTDNEVTLS